MVEDRRTPEASGLRLLFQEQWAHFLHLLADWNRHRHRRHGQLDELAAAVEQVVSGTDARIRSVGGYKRQLRESVHAVLNYVDTLVDGLPAAVSVSRETFFSDPLVSSFFVNTEDIRQIFCETQELQQFFANDTNRELAEVYALLFVRKTEKTVLGRELCGNLLLGDIKQTTVNFSDHQILSPCATEQLARQSLKAMLFRSVVQYVRVHMIRARYQQSQEDALRKHYDPIHSLKNPIVFVQELNRVLSRPMELLKQQERMLRVDRMNISLSEHASTPGNELHLNEITIGDQQTRIVVMVRYPRNEFLAWEER